MAEESRHTLQKRIGENIERIRNEQGINKQTFSLMTGIGRPTLNNIENGRADMRLSYLDRIAEALSVDPIDLLSEN